MTLEQIKDRFAGTPYEDVMAELCDRVQLLEDLILRVNDERDRPQANKSDKAHARQGN